MGGVFPPAFLFAIQSSLTELRDLNIKSRMRKLAIITGGSKGLGKSLVEEYCQRNFQVISIARSRTDYKHVNFRGQIEFDFSDISTLETSLKVQLKAIVNEGFDKVTLINNAATLGQIGKVIDYSSAEFALEVQLNFVAPIAFSNLIIKMLQGKKAELSILNVSSGAANRAINGWGMYCSTKAALDMISKVMAAENNGDAYKIAIINPGIMDTDMQGAIRNSATEDFPLVETFRQYHQDNMLVPPATIARLIAELDEKSDYESGETIRIEERFEAPRNQ